MVITDLMPPDVPPEQQAVNPAEITLAPNVVPTADDSAQSPQARFVIDSEFRTLPPAEKPLPDEDVVMDAKEVATRYESRLTEKKRLEAELSHLDQVLNHGVMHARRILATPGAEGLDDDLHQKLENIVDQNKPRQQR